MSAENGACIPIELTDRVGKRHKFQFTPFTDRDHSEMDEYFGQRMIRLAAKAVEWEPDRIKLPTIAAATITAASLSWLSGPGLKMFATVDGMSRAVWQGIRAEHSNIDQEWIRRELFDPVNKHTAENTNEVTRLLNRIHHGGDDDKESPDPT